jgi:hypothetical protein
LLNKAWGIKDNRTAIKAVQTTFIPSRTATSNPHQGPNSRTVLVAPAFPEPVVRMSMPLNHLVIKIDQEIEPIKYPAIAFLNSLKTL